MDTSTAISPFQRAVLVSIEADQAVRDAKASWSDFLDPASRTNLSRASRMVRAVACRALTDLLDERGINVWIDIEDAGWICVRVTISETTDLAALGSALAALGSALDELAEGGPVSVSVPGVDIDPDLGTTLITEWGLTRPDKGDVTVWLWRNRPFGSAQAAIEAVLAG